MCVSVCLSVRKRLTFVSPNQLKDFGSVSWLGDITFSRPVKSYPQTTPNPFPSPPPLPSSSAPTKRFVVSCAVCPFPPPLPLLFVVSSLFPYIFFSSPTPSFLSLPSSFFPSLLPPLPLISSPSLYLLLSPPLLLFAFSRPLPLPSPLPFRPPLHLPSSPPLPSLSFLAYPFPPAPFIFSTPLFFSITSLHPYSFPSLLSVPSTPAPSRLPWPLHSPLLFPPALGHGSKSLPGNVLGWVRLVIWWVELSWVDEINSWTTLNYSQML